MTKGPDADFDPIETQVYHELRRIAARLMGRERAGGTLQATELVHEALLALHGGGSNAAPADRAALLPLAARVMRHLLVDRARARRSLKRGAGAERLSFEEIERHLPQCSEDLAALDEALEDLARRDPRKGKLVELRFFAGCTIEESAAALGISHATVEREWKFSKAWLASRLAPDEDDAH